MKRRAQPWLGTLVDITIADDLDEGRVREAMDSAFAEIAQVHQLMSFHNESSDIRRINQARPGDSISVHHHTHAVLTASERIREASRGIFNIACASRLAAWGQLPQFDSRPPDYMPDQPVIQMEEHHVVTKLTQGWIDVGGIAKGYAVDLAVDALRAAAIGSACVNAGGDIRVFGERPFTVTIRDPRLPTRMCGKTELMDEAMATSAPYFSMIEIDGQSVSALCNGLNGRPIVEPVSVSVCASSCMIADALTKVVLSTGDSNHLALKSFGATAFIV
jgi:thiamine biosynthesis lipoprotein